METLTDRVTRHLLKRLRHSAMMTAYDKAERAGLLTSAFIGGNKRIKSAWLLTDRARQVLSGHPRRDWQVVGRLLRAHAAPRQQAGSSFDFSSSEGDPADGSVVFDRATPALSGQRPNGKRRNVRQAGADRGSGSVTAIDFPYIAALMREHIPPPNPIHVAVALLVARAIGTSLPTFGPLASALRAPAPFVLLKAPVARFEQCFGVMLEDGLLLPFSTSLDDLLRVTPLSGRFKQSTVPDQRRLRTLSGLAVDGTGEKIVRRQFRQALIEEPVPIILVDETRSALTPVVTETADLVLECTGFDRPMIAELLLICTGIAPSHSLMVMDRMDFDPDTLSLDDIALAVRPERSVEQTLSVMTMLAEHLAAEGGGRDKSSDKDFDGKKHQSGTGRGKEKKKEPSIGFEVIEPAALPIGGNANEDEAADPIAKDRLLLVETLSGYGAALDWALDLKTDLSLWKSGRLRWDEMSTKLLLSGPPGTGKTMFARALCNTLQVPLLATSVAHWLEPGYLGDVLQAMSAAFSFAADRAPAILFIDEIDNIGRRQTSTGRSHDDYWTSLINRMLELLDGTSKSEGVIVVGASNLPERIDPALLRSGRLETHVPIPLPDTDALIGILGRHLGPDLHAVLQSAPAPAVLPRLRPRPAIDSVPLVRRKPLNKPQSEKGPGHDEN